MEWLFIAILVFFGVRQGTAIIAEGYIKGTLLGIGIVLAGGLVLVVLLALLGLLSG